MKITKDHDNYDYLSVSLKRAYSDRIIKCYLALGWKGVHAENDKDYDDMKYVLFSRPHKFPNKDRLQYIQVRMENILNGASEHAIKRHKKSTALAVFFGLAGLGLIAAGLSLALIFSMLAVRICGWVCVGLGGASLLTMIYPLTKVRKKENARTKAVLEKDFAEFERLVREAAALSGRTKIIEGGKSEAAAAESV